jgi:hypothetical protein
MQGMTKAELRRSIIAAIEAARRQRLPIVEVKLGDGVVVRIPLEKPVAEPNELVL